MKHSDYSCQLYTKPLVSFFPKCIPKNTGSLEHEQVFHERRVLWPHKNTKRKVEASQADLYTIKPPGVTAWLECAMNLPEEGVRAVRSVVQTSPDPFSQNSSQNYTQEEGTLASFA